MDDISVYSVKLFVKRLEGRTEGDYMLPYVLLEDSTKEIINAYAFTYSKDELGIDIDESTIKVENIFIRNDGNELYHIFHARLTGNAREKAMKYIAPQIARRVLLDKPMWDLM